MRNVDCGLSVICLVALTACQGAPTLQWQSLPKNVLVADAARTFAVPGRGAVKTLALPKDRSLLGRADADRLALYKIGSKALSKTAFRISKNTLTGNFTGGTRYLLHAPLQKSPRNKYALFCKIRAVSTRLTALRPGIIDRLCPRILCPNGPFVADRLLDEFTELQRFPNQFGRNELRNMRIDPIPSGIGPSNLCDQCLGRDWDVVIVPDCHEIVPPVIRWVPYGPRPNTVGQVENILNREVVGAINAVAPHSTDATIVYVGAVNGGIWRTANAMAANPSWTQQTGDAQTLSIGALEFDPTDATNRTLVAGIGRFSSFRRRGGARLGLLRTTNGTSWTAIDGGGALRGLNISGVAPRGATIVIAANAANTFANRGVWRSTDTGATWTQLSGAIGSGIPTGAAFDLTGDPTNPARLYASVGGNGIYRSTDTGATWTRVSNAAMNARIQFAGNIEIAVGTANNVYVAIVSGRRLASIFRSGNGGTTWTAMDLPTTADGGIHPGGQGNIHLSIAADPNNANTVYIGGDRQGLAGNFWPNAIGAQDWTGNLFRGDASQPAGSQFTPLTHVNTASSSAPHADSRDMDVAANGVLIEVDDGGVYRRTTPRTNNGDWFSMNGDIQTTEFHDAAWDSNADIVIGGAQDTGTPEQRIPANVTWRSVSTGDGGDVAVDDTGTPGLSVRYSSFQNLGLFRRRTYDSNNVLQSQVFPNLTVLGAGNPIAPLFTTPIEINNVNPARLIIGAGNSVYESLDQGDTVTEVLTATGGRVVVNAAGNDPIAYGGAGNANMLYVGSGARVFLRTAAAPAAIAASATYPGTGNVVDIAIDPAGPNTAFVADAANVFFTADAGATWTDVTGNFPTLNAGTIRSLVFRGGTSRAAAVGTDTGVYIAQGPAFNNWARLATGLPRVPVYDLDYDVQDRIFVAGTLGRGAWVLREN